ncbi:MAG: Rpp14/Pop5 family protein [Promethearchaeota archaeon]
MKKKERQRYVRFRVFSREYLQLNEKIIANVIWRQFNSLFGEVESGRAGFWIVDFSTEKNEGIIRCAHRAFEKLICTMTLITVINEIEVSIDTYKTSGIMNKVIK